LLQCTTSDEVRARRAPAHSLNRPGFAAGRVGERAAAKAQNAVIFAWIERWRSAMATAFALAFGCTLHNWHELCSTSLRPLGFGYPASVAYK
jgi:hypothetical protein